MKKINLKLVRNKALEEAAKEADRFVTISLVNDGGWGGGCELAVYFKKLAENIRAKKK